MVESCAMSTPAPADPAPADPGPVDPAPVDPRLLEILVCPVTKGPLTYDRAAAELISPRARLAYPVRDGIPIMLPDEARALDSADSPA
jgi:uncharacterized protein YbaR (Trm112 family)